MKDTSGGSQVDPHQFLTAYSEGVDKAIQQLQRERQPGTGKRAMSGEEGMSIREKAMRGEIIV